MGKLTYILLTGCAGLVIAAPPPSTPAAPKKVAPVVVSKFGPSRYAGEDLKSYIEGLTREFSSGSRVNDPFGQPQDPEAKPIAKPSVQKIVRRFTPVAPTALSEIVGKLPITMVMPKSRRFIVDSRNLGIGDKLPITYRNANIQLEITEVNASRIVFKNAETGELGVYKFNDLPEGISHGKDSIKMPGIRPNAPLEIEAPSQTTTNPSP